MLFLIVIGTIILGIIAAVLIKPEQLTESEKRERAKERMLERDRIEKEKEELRAKYKAEEERKAKEKEELRAKYKAEEELKAKEAEELRGKIEEESKVETEENIEEAIELEKKSLEEVIKGKIRKSRPLTMNEQPLFRKLRETLEPEYVVLSQVSFGAILWTWSHAVRNRFNRKIVDFVICDKGFNVIAVIELDDSSHKGKEERDAERDLLLNEAGITVIRYKSTPESKKILEDIKSLS